MNELRTVLRSVGGPSAISWPAFWVVLIITVPLQLTDAIGSSTLRDIPGRLAVVVLGTAVLFAVLLGGRRLLLRDVATRPRPGRTLAVFLVATVLRGLAIAVLLDLLVDLESPVAYRVGASVATILPVLIVMALVVDRSRTQARRRAELAAAAERLRIAEEYAQREIDVAHTATVERIREELVRAVEEAATASPEGVIDRLRAEVNERIRPLSHRLATAVPTWSPQVDAVPVRGVAWRDLWRDTTRGRPFRPAVVATVSALMLAPAASVRLGLVLGVVVMIVVGGALGLALTLARAIIGPWLSRSRRASLRLVVFLAAIIVVYATAAGVLELTLRLASASALALVVAVVAVGPLVAVLVAVAQAVGASLREIDADLETTTLAYDRAVARVQAVAWQRQRLLALAMHGPLQARVTAAALRLEQDVRAGTVSADAVDRALRDVVDALDHLELDTDAVGDVRADLDDVVEAWEGVCAVHVNMEGALADRIDRAPVTARVLVDIVTEACSNAVRHARASEVRLSVEQDEVERLRICVRDDGTSGATQGIGLGSRLLDEVALNWERRDERGETVLEVVLPGVPA